MSMTVDELVRVYTGLDYERQVSVLETLLHASHRPPESDFTETLALVPMMTSEMRLQTFRDVWDWRMSSRHYQFAHQRKKQQEQKDQREYESQMDEESAEEFLNDMLNQV